MERSFWKNVEEVISPSTLKLCDISLLIGPLGILLAASSLLLKGFPFYGITLFFASLLHIVFLFDKPLFSKSCFVSLILFSFFCLKGQAKELFFFNLSWILSLLLSSALSYALRNRMRKGQRDLVEREEKWAKEAELWKHRFQITQEKKGEEERLLEEALVKQEELMEKLSLLEGKKPGLLIEGRELGEEEVRAIVEEFKETKLQLKESEVEREALLEQIQTAQREIERNEEVVQQRQLRNLNLLAKKERPSISLKEIAKKI